MDKKTPNYNDKLKAISSYFGVSEGAAKYIFHRRRKGFPWKKDADTNYFEWSIQLQNAFIKADNITLFDWRNLNFNNDIQILAENNIIVNEQPNTIQFNKRKIDKDLNEEDDDAGGGWTIVTKNKTLLIQKHLLKDMGFLPRYKRPYDTKVKTPENVSKQEKITDSKEIKTELN
jgi:hypothetical protein